MGEMISGGGDRTVTLPNKTAAKQQNSDTRRNDAFIQKYLQLFQGGPVNNTFRDTLSGYYGGAPIDQIANKVAITGAFKPRVAPVTRSTTGGRGVLDGLMGEQGPFLDFLGF